MFVVYKSELFLVINVMAVNTSDRQTLFKIFMAHNVFCTLCDQAQLATCVLLLTTVEPVMSSHRKRGFLKQVAAHRRCISLPRS